MKTTAIFSNCRPATPSGLAALFCAAALLPALALCDDWQLPAELKDAVAALEPAQQAFIVSGDARQFMPTRQIEHELATRPPAAMRQLVSDLMAVAAELGYEPERDMGAIPLNLTSRQFNAGFTTTPEPLRKIERTPGPFSVHRYLFTESGIPTFAGAKVAIYPEDLAAGNVDVAIIGIPSDMGSGRRDAGHGPLAMRGVNTIATPDVKTLLNPLDVLSVVDYGNFSVDYLSTQRTIGHVTDMVAETAATGAVPMMVGGDTSMLYPGVAGVARHHGHGSFGLVHFSAHPDVHRTAVHTMSDTQAVFRLIYEQVVDGRHLIQVGLRGNDVTVENLQWLREQGVRYHTMAAIEQHGYDAVLERVLDEVARGPDRLFVSIDVSVIEPTEMVAAGRIASHGLRVQEVTRAIRRLCAEREIVGFELTDMAPMLDYSRLSAMNANAVLNACLVGMAARKAGLASDYIHPLALDHEQD